MYEFDGVNGFGNNHEAVRYASAGLCFAACDETECERRGKNAFDYLMGHLRANQGHRQHESEQRGWDPEGKGYTFYPWQFTGPFVIAARRLWGFDFGAEVPPARQMLFTTYLACAALPYPSFDSQDPAAAGPSLGLHNDFVDDNAICTAQGTANIAFGPGVSLPEHLPGMLWAYRRMYGDLGDRHFSSHRGGALYALLFLPDEEGPGQPPTDGWLVYNDTSYGMTLARSGYAMDGSDIIVQHTAKHRQCYQCHSSSDVNGFRLLGVGSAWAAGAGRITKPQGQTSLFPEDPELIPDGDTQARGQLVRQPCLREGLGTFSVVRGSATFVGNHTRRVLADFGAAGALGGGVKAVVVVGDTSINGSVWRLNTPDFNDLELLPTVAKAEADLDGSAGDHSEGTAVPETFRLTVSP